MRFIENRFFVFLFRDFLVDLFHSVAGIKTLRFIVLILMKRLTEIRFFFENFEVRVRIKCHDKDIHDLAFPKHDDLGCLKRNFVSKYQFGKSFYLFLDFYVFFVD